LDKAGFDGTVAVQALQTLEETRWLLELSDQNPFIKAVVGWVDLRSDAVGQQFDEFVPHSKFRGVRHIVQDEPDDYMSDGKFQRGIAAVGERGLTYDLLVFPRQLPAAVELVRRFPSTRFVLDHLAKPEIAAGKMDPWRDDVRELAGNPNVFCKLSGLVTEANWKGWRREEFTPYLDVAFEVFGPRRLMVGSDWPVCLPASDYGSVMNVVKEYLAPMSGYDRDAVLGGNAAGFYRIRV
jgi:L-fuconolactonase